MNRILVITLCLLEWTALSGCASMRSVLAADSSSADHKSIHNPFGDFYSTRASEPSDQQMILRTKRGDRSVEVQLPRYSGNDMTDLVIPAFPTDAPNTSSAGNAFNPDNTYKDRAPTATDREITSRFPQGDPRDLAERTQIERGLGLKESDSGVPERDLSYLASIDHLKQLYKAGRFEAGLIETDDLLKRYPTDPKLYQMRGTLLDRLGKTDLAVISWKQALRFDPTNRSLAGFIEHKEKRAGMSQ